MRDGIGMTYSSLGGKGLNYLCYGPILNIFLKFFIPPPSKKYIYMYIV